LAFAYPWACPFGVGAFQALPTAIRGSIGLVSWAVQIVVEAVHTMHCTVLAFGTTATVVATSASCTAIATGTWQDPWEANLAYPS
jgi:hypothetical protein